MRFKTRALAFLLTCGVLCGAEPAAFRDVTSGMASHGFRAAAVYLNDADQPFGARFIHQATGFTLDLIEVQSVPQAFNWVNSFPVSDRGQPHTQEHLLMGKGNMGRAWAASQTMTLTEATAFTMQWRTCYSFNTRAGLPVFYDEFRLQLEALLRADYTDEEIRREVRNFGVAENPATHELRLEEKGTVYNEMTSSMNKPEWVLFKQLARDLYGPKHPLAYNSGGEPAGIREMVPADIRAFHDRHYFLGNMGSVVSLPKGETVAARLARFDRILTELQPAKIGRAAESEDTLPRPTPAPAGTVRVIDFPFENEQQPGYVGLAWPAVRKLDARDTLLLDIFLDSFAGGATTNLYKLFINSKTRKLDLGAESIFGYLEQDQGFPVIIGLQEVAAANLTEAKTREIRGLVTGELKRLAALPDGSPELADFNRQARSRLVEQKRSLARLVNSPPGFGSRGGGSAWMEQLYHLNREPGFRKSVTLKPDIEAADKLLAGNRNLWRELLAKWHLTDTEPIAIATRPAAEALRKQRQETAERIEGEVKRLESQYNTGDRQEAIRLYEKSYDAESARMDEFASQTPARPFPDAPPLTLDEQLEYSATRTAAGVPLVTSVFDNMTSSTTALALRLDGVPEADLPLLSLLPVLMTQAGVIVDGKPVPYEQMEEMLRREILSLDARFTANVRTDRAELVVRGAGNDAAESKRAIEWMSLVLEHPDWRAENLPRLRDLVGQQLARLRATMQGSEESWVMNPVLSYWKQSNPLYLTTTSFLTRAFNADRLRWMLADTGAEDRAALAARIRELGERAGTREQMTALLDGLKNESGAMKAVALDLAQLLPDLPDASLARDWKFLCGRIADDLSAGPEQTLARLDALRRGLLRAGGARAWQVGSKANLTQLTAPLSTLLTALTSGAPEKAQYRAARAIDERLQQHQSEPATPRYVGLYDANLTGGVMASIVPSISYDETGRDAQLDFLASRVFAGYGAHGIFTKTITAGLAYSNGMRGNIRDGWSGYYAERMPEIPQTLHFAIDVIKKGPRDPKLADYAIAMAFQESNAAGSYEARAESIAAELADGVGPEKVRRFREAILNLRRDPDLAAEIFRRIDTVHGRLLPGYGPGAKENSGAVYFIIGNDKQFAAMDNDVQTREGEHVYKLYPRDYWLPLP